MLHGGGLRSAWLFAASVPTPSPPETAAAAMCELSEGNGYVVVPKWLPVDAHDRRSKSLALQLPPTAAVVGCLRTSAARAAEPRTRHSSRRAMSRVARARTPALAGAVGEGATPCTASPHACGVHTAASLAQLTRAELQAAAKRHRVRANQKSADIIAQLVGKAETGLVATCTSQPAEQPSAQPLWRSSRSLDDSCAATLAAGRVHKQRAFAKPALVAALRRSLGERPSLTQHSVAMPHQLSTS